jgi:hypothetical protein
MGAKLTLTRAQYVTQNSGRRWQGGAYTDVYCSRGIAKRISSRTELILKVETDVALNRRTATKPTPGLFLVKKQEGPLTMRSLRGGENPKEAESLTCVLP